MTVVDLTAAVGDRLLLDAVSFQLRPGRVTALVGPSGSGKTTAALALLGEHRAGVALRGEVTVTGHVVVDGSGVRPDAHLVRGKRIAYLPQHPGGALNPARRVGSALEEIASVHRGRSGRGEAAVEALRAAGLPGDRAVRRRFPHRFSGGQRQRVALAQALVCGPDVLVLDEPTTGLDPVAKRHVVAELAELARGGLAVLLLTHDLPVVEALAHEVVHLDAGRVVLGETPAPAAPVFAEPAPDAPPVLRVRGLGAHHRAAGRAVPVLHGVDLDLPRGWCVGLVGASGSGKTTLARCLAGLHERMTGRVLLDDEPLPVLRRRAVGQRRRVQYVWQEVRGSFEEHVPVLDGVARTAVRLRGLGWAEARAEAAALLARLGVAEETASRLPTALSGGELQRAAVVRAVLAEPDVLVCDEVTTALHADAATAVLDLLDELRRERGTAVLLISHDARVVRARAQHAHVLHEGRIVDSGPPARLVAEPGTEVTAALLAPGGEW
ncbi:peptide/nickel transport system ATP-binding protein [Actinosynnema pretiosum]|nr:peptide/nickel transport system ATP-binding protein [Actinosynnema pretiosum]